MVAPWVGWTDRVEYRTPGVPWNPLKPRKYGGRSTLPFCGHPAPQAWRYTHVRADRSGDAEAISNHRNTGVDMPRSVHFIASRAAEGIAFYTISIGALTVWAHYCEVRRQHALQA